VARLLTFLMIFALVATQGVSMAAAMCRHQDAQAHILARQSKDAAIAAVSVREDAAAAAASKKAPGSGDSFSHWPAELLPATSEATAPPTAENLRLRPARQIALRSTNVPPLLEPPAA
jgi:hypothetical protein